MEIKQKLFITKYIIILEHKIYKCLGIKDQLYDNEDQAKNAINDFKLENNDYNYYIKKIEL